MIYFLLCTFLPGFNAHEFILDPRQFKNTGVEGMDIAKRLQDYGEFSHDQFEKIVFCTKSFSSNKSGVSWFLMFILPFTHCMHVYACALYKTCSDQFATSDFDSLKQHHIAVDVG